MTLIPVSKVFVDFTKPTKVIVVKAISVICVLFLLSENITAQTADTLKPNYKALRRIFLIESGAYSATIIGLSKAWYTKPMHTFKCVNDSHEWLKIDKVGHTLTAYQIAKYSSLLYKSTNISASQSVFYGTLSGFLFQLPIEVLDGFQYPDYGFSVSDIAANTAGSLLFFSQQKVWNEERVYLKYSFHKTNLASVRPELLGRNMAQQMLKDYNGQTYWLSFNINRLTSLKHTPKWLNLSIGYGIQNMVSAEPQRSKILGYVPYSQWYLSLDIDLERIPTKNRTLKTAFKLLNIIKIPAPTIEWSKPNGIKTHWLYF